MMFEMKYTILFFLIDLELRVNDIYIFVHNARIFFLIKYACSDCIWLKLSTRFIKKNNKMVIK